MPVYVGVMPEFHYDLRPRKKRRTLASVPVGCTVVTRLPNDSLPKDSNKAFRISSELLQDAMLKYHGQKGSKEGCSSQETVSNSKQNTF